MSAAFADIFVAHFEYFQQNVFSVGREHRVEVENKTNDQVDCLQRWYRRFTWNSRCLGSSQLDLNFTTPTSRTLFPVR